MNWTRASELSQVQLTFSLSHNYKGDLQLSLESDTHDYKIAVSNPGSHNLYFFQSAIINTGTVHYKEATTL